MIESLTTSIYAPPSRSSLAAQFGDESATTTNRKIVTEGEDRFLISTRDGEERKFKLASLEETYASQKRRAEAMIRDEQAQLQMQSDMLQYHKQHIEDYPGKIAELSDQLQSASASEQSELRQQIEYLETELSISQEIYPEFAAAWPQFQEQHESNLNAWQGYLSELNARAEAEGLA